MPSYEEREKEKAREALAHLQGQWRGVLPLFYDVIRPPFVEAIDRGVYFRMSTTSGLAGVMRTSSGAPLSLPPGRSKHDEVRWQVPRDTYDMSLAQRFVLWARENNREDLLATHIAVHGTSLEGSGYYHYEVSSYFAIPRTHVIAALEKQDHICQEPYHAPSYGFVRGRSTLVLPDASGSTRLIYDHHSEDPFRTSQMYHYWGVDPMGHKFAEYEGRVLLGTAAASFKNIRDLLMLANDKRVKYLDQFAHWGKLKDRIEGRPLT